MATIYALTDPRREGIDVIRYIGVTSQSLDHRLSNHVFGATCPSTRRHINHRVHWIRALLKEGVRPVIVALESVAGDGFSREREVIAEYRLRGANLVNTTDGGEGTLGRKHRPESRVLMSSRLKGKQYRRGPLPGTPLPEESKRKLREYYANPEHRRMAGERNIGRTLSDEHRAKISAKGRGVKKPAWFSAKVSASLSGRKLPAEQLAAMVQHHQTPEYRAKLSEIKRIWWAKRKAA